MSNSYFQRSVSKAKCEDDILLIRILLEQLQDSEVHLVSKKDIVNGIEIGLSSFYPHLAIKLGDKLEEIIQQMFFDNIISFQEDMKKIWVMPASLEERLKFKRLQFFEFKKFINILIKFTNKRAKGQLVRNAKDKDEGNSLLLEFYAFLSYVYALYLFELGSTIPIYFRAEKINEIADNLFERAYELDKEFIVCCNVSELIKNYFICIKYLVDSYFPE